jgi:hypothetical protein
MVNLYKPVNDEFVLLWNKVHPHANPTWIAQVQNQLSEALPPYFDCTESQAADLRVTQQWLRTMLWQLCVSQGLVSSVSADITMTFKYPIEISRDLLALTTQFSQQAMEVHGVGLVSLSKSRRVVCFKYRFGPETVSSILSLILPRSEHLTSMHVTMSRARSLPLLAATRNLTDVFSFLVA